ncbi:MAG TPA: phospholipase D-like domain-containing protein [Acetobacteraceae bacterium]|nr:phospholipase D-like domain-containing protein [Acetobacteraceae bacterium]
MLPVRIGLVSHSASIDFSALVRVASALGVQLTRDAGPIWGLAGNVFAVEDPNQLEPGVWPIFIVDDLDPGMNGYHQTDHNQPFAMVLAGDTWSLTASHELLELLVDPSGNRLVAAPAVHITDNEVQDTDGKFEYLVEVCDPSEDASCAYLIDGVLVSDFYTPNYFDPAGSAGARYSFSGRITRPRQVLPNGYLSWFNPSNNKIQQVRHFGAPEIVDLGVGAPGGGSVTGGRSLRGFVDSVTNSPEVLSQLHPSSPAVRGREQRQSFLAAVAPRRASLYTAAVGALLRPGAPPPAQPKVDIAAALAANIGQFGQPGVVSVRPGWRFGPQGMTGERAVIITVLPERMTALASALPRDVQGVPVELRAAGPMQAMQAQHPAQYLALGAARHELRQPEFANETFFDAAGKPIQPPAPHAAFAAQHPRKENIPYAPPADATLDAVRGPVSLVLHASPDAGWAQLSKFLDGVGSELVVGMYDFTSAHILAAVGAAMAGGKKLTLTLDHPAPNPSRDQTDEDTQQELREKLGDAYKGAWALTNSDRMATAWIYPNAYHIKVAVRDDGTFWLSSGNWNNSNQPEIDLSDLAAARKIATGHDRDWHVIATHPALADTFRKFLANDFAVASQHNAAAATAALSAAGPEIEVPVAVLGAGRAPRKFFAPKTVSGDIEIQPLLTPDNYVANVRPLIESARQKFYMQTQYIHPSGRDGDADHDALIAAVAKLVADGVDVKLITSEFQTDDWVEKVVDAGIPGSVLRRQNKVHNKGVVVDSAVVMVTSQNWSADGTLRNRDAGLIIHSAEAAAYFEEIFLHDWNNLASPVTAG